MTFFKIIWGFDALAALIVLYFFFIGLSDGTVSSFNMGIWTIIVGSLAVIMLGSLWLKANQYPGFAVSLLLILAIPAFLYLLFMLLMLGHNGRWN